VEGVVFGEGEMRGVVFGGIAGGEVGWEGATVVGCLNWREPEGKGKRASFRGGRLSDLLCLLTVPFFYVRRASDAIWIRFSG
jgi:hypothetical protein